MERRFDEAKGGSDFGCSPQYSRPPKLPIPGACLFPRCLVSGHSLPVPIARLSLLLGSGPSTTLPEPPTPLPSRRSEGRFGGGELLRSRPGWELWPEGIEGISRRATWRVPGSCWPRTAAPPRRPCSRPPGRDSSSRGLIPSLRTKHKAPRPRHTSPLDPEATVGGGFSEPTT